jgi:hypothetical protein
MRQFNDPMERAKALVVAGIAVDIATALLIADAPKTPLVVEVVENGVRREISHDDSDGQG